MLFGKAFDDLVKKYFIKAKKEGQIEGIEFTFKLLKKYLDGRAEKGCPEVIDRTTLVAFREICKGEIHKEES